MISWRKHYKKGALAIGLLFSTFASVQAQDGDPNNGEKLFKSNCAACHALDKQLVGPALGGVVERLKAEQNLETDWLHKWIKNNEELRASGDKYANEVYEKFQKVAMTPFPNLSDKDIDDILAYTTNPPVAAPAEDETANAVDLATIEKERKESINSKIILLSFLAIGGMLLWLMVRLRKMANQLKVEKYGPDAIKRQSFAELYRKYRYVGNAILIVLAVAGFYGVWNGLMGIGVYRGYKPEQPIHFSHKIHAGVNKIDCQMCHSSAKYGKVSEIPSLNVCMNCHRNISEYTGKYFEDGKDKAFYDGEIQKIYKATGWDPSAQQYTGKTEPVEWVRIHNMPDFVYFNHAQHVVVGEQAILNAYNKKNPNAKIDVVCKACHGQVNEMDVVEMANDFTMGWCIECHRTTEVDMNNGYNKEYFQNLHEKLKKQYPKSEGKITVDAIGGLECGKCHY